MSETKPLCTGCGRPGKPYTHHGEEFDGLCTFGRERLCPSCRDATLVDCQEHMQKDAPVDVLSISRCARDQSSRRGSAGNGGRYTLV